MFHKIVINTKNPDNQAVNNSQPENKPVESHQPTQSPNSVPFPSTSDKTAKVNPDPEARHKLKLMDKVNTLESLKELIDK